YFAKHLPLTPDVRQWLETKSTVRLTKSQLDEFQKLIHNSYWAYSGRTEPTMMHAVYGSKGQHIGWRRGMEILNLKKEKLFEVDPANRLIDPVTKKVAGYLQPVGDVSPDKSLDHLFEN